MNINWKSYRLEEIADIIGGGTPSTQIPEYFGGEIPWLTPRDLTNYPFRFISKGERNITQEGLKNSSARLLPKNTILLTSRAPIGYLAIASNELTTNQGFKSFVLKENLVDRDFLFYILKTNIEYIKSLGTGSTFGEVPAKTLKDLSFSFPEKVSEQKKIASILSSLDDKIELNLKMNQTLESIAQAIFKQWFVNFQFPGATGEMENGLPKGWRYLNLGDVSKLIAGGDKPNNCSEQPNEVNKIPIYSNGITNEGLYGYTDEARVNEESVTVSSRGTIGYVCLRMKPYVPIVRLIAVVPNKNFVTSKYLYVWLRNQNIVGTGTTQQQLTVPDFRMSKVLVPKIEIINQFTSIMDSIFQKIEDNKLQNITLSSIRDSLLPKLITGKIKV